MVKLEDKGLDEFLMPMTALSMSSVPFELIHLLSLLVHLRLDGLDVDVQVGKQELPSQGHWMEAFGTLTVVPQPRVCIEVIFGQVGARCDAPVDLNALSLAC